MTWRVELGDCLAVMRTLPEASVDAVVTDPPYGIGFMGHEWDQPAAAPAGHRSSTPRSLARVGSSAAVHAGSYDLAPAALRAFQEWTSAWATEVLRVLKPGGHLVSFASTRTNHRHVCGIEDGGFEIRDSLCWLFGEGFPKSHNLTGDWEGWGSALKPAHEPIALARAPLAVRAMRDNVAEHGVGALHVAACRIDSGTRATRLPTPGSRASVATVTDAGRWPANVLVDEEAAAAIDEQSGVLLSGANPTRRSADKFAGVYGDFRGREECIPARGQDAGGASRFFYCAKASRGERDAGLTDVEATEKETWSSGDANPGAFQSGGTRALARNAHPTVKPIALMRWLGRLVARTGAVVLDPFTGSGTTGIAAVLEGCDFIGIEREASYASIARGRIAHWERTPWIPASADVALVGQVTIDELLADERNGAAAS